MLNTIFIDLAQIAMDFAGRLAKTVRYIGDRLRAPDHLIDRWTLNLSG